MPATTTTMSGLLKEDIEPGIISELNDEAPLVDSFGTGKPIRGKGLVKGIRVNRNRGGYYTAEGGGPPVAGTPEIQELLIPNSYYHHAWSITKQLMDASASGEAAFGDAMEIGMQDVKDVLLQRRNAAFWGWRSGVLCLMNGTSNATTALTVDSPGGLAGADDGSRFVNVDDYIACVNPAGALQEAAAFRVTAVPTSATITVASNVTAWTDNFYVVRCQQTAGTLTLGNTEYMHAPVGLSAIVDNGTLMNIYFGKSRTTFPILNALVTTGVGALGADIIQRQLDVSAKQGGRTNEIWVEPGVKRAYLKSMEGDRRYTAADLLNPNAGTVAASTGRRYAETGLKFGTIPIYQDHMAPYQQMFGLDTRWIKRHPGPMGWVDEDGNVLIRSTTAVDTFNATFRCYEQLSSEKPNTSWKLTGITHDFVASHVV